ncbi:PREDICTED: receptor-like kinase TMK4 [Camelina sativa]|uniref:Receptor-like kinase TMK4 n=1 Tax=Camelina sativa TaxID=90675 RepID=A0ABM1RGP5_CAMSA|nr:PREDICTED: receptor-like kinase TMK4 [Camelina sativa]
MKVIHFIVFSFFVIVTASQDDDGAAMLAVSKGFQPHPPDWSTRSSLAYCKWKGVECNRINHRVTSLNLCGLSLGGMISPAISSLLELVEVNLQNNQLIGKIPRVPRHVKFIYRPGNQLLGQRPRDKETSIWIIIAGICGGALVLITISILVYIYQLKKFSVRNIENGRTRDVHRALIRDGALDDETEHDRDEDRLYPLDSLRQATNDFSEENILGEGGSGIVYKGVQHDGTIIAIKRINVGAVDERATNEFKSEIKVLTSLRHKHLVPLLGFCNDGNEKLLVYEYMPLGTLAHHLFEWSNRGYTPLTWNQRIVIALDIAPGVQYLHGLARRNYIHGDLKPSNVLIGDGIRAKISDFGCIKLIPEGIESVETATVVGTFGYLDPDYVGTKRVTKKADVYAFGVILMEIITGRKANDDTLSDEEQNVVMWLRPKIKHTTFLTWIDGTIATDDETIESIKKIAKLAEYCTSQEVERRPNMFQTVNLLVPLVEHWESPPSEEDTEKDTTTLLEKLHRWKTEADEGTSMAKYGEPSGTKYEKTKSQRSSSRLEEIEMTSR